MHALRKTEGPFAAGTRVEVLTDNTDGTVTVEVQLPDPGKHPTHFMLDEMVFDVDANDVVKLRDKTDSVSSTSRTERRAFLKNLFGPTKGT